MIFRLDKSVGGPIRKMISRGQICWGWHFGWTNLLGIPHWEDEFSWTNLLGMTFWLDKSAGDPIRRMISRGQIYCYLDKSRSRFAYNSWFRSGIQRTPEQECTFKGRPLSLRLGLARLNYDVLFDDELAFGTFICFRIKLSFLLTGRGHSIWAQSMHLEA